MIRIIVGFLAFYLFVEIVYAQSSTQSNVKPVPEVIRVKENPASTSYPKPEYPAQVDLLLKTLETQKAEIEHLKRQNEILKTRLEEVWEIINWHPKTTMPH